ncbi:hypothetical protein JTB14_001381 [Gonioctena quinquepunctata]|nr:hypothetical protein JTB14_001381 [Gonioctena quinquepunctata]
MSEALNRRLTRDWSREIESTSSILKAKVKGGSRLHRGFIQLEKPLEKFVTGSTFEGKQDSLGFAGLGTYVFPHGAIYRGYFQNGQFHGDGIITYPKGQELDGSWEKGKLVNYTFRFKDGLEYQRDWTYCQLPDRTYEIETYLGLQPPEKEFLTNNPHATKIPEKSFNTGDGYYTPKSMVIHNYQHKVIRICLPGEEDQIESNFRKIQDEPVGYHRELFEHWTSGRRKELDNIVERVYEDSV